MLEILAKPVEGCNVQLVEYNDCVLNFQQPVGG